MSSSTSRPSLDLEPNPFELSFKQRDKTGPGTPGPAGLALGGIPGAGLTTPSQYINTPGGTTKRLLPPVAAISSPQSLLTGAGGVNGGGGTGTPGWINSLRSGPLSPAMLQAPQPDQTAFPRGMLTPFQTDHLAGLSPLVPPPPQMASQHPQQHHQQHQHQQQQQTQHQPQMGLQTQTGNAEAANSLYMLAKNLGAEKRAGGAQTDAGVPVPAAKKAKIIKTEPPQGILPNVSGAPSTISSLSSTNTAPGHSNSNGVTASAPTSTAHPTNPTTINNPTNTTTSTSSNSNSNNNGSNTSSISPSSTAAPASGGGKKKKAMTDEEKRKSFLERNRVAALKCRQRKKQWLENLQARCEYYAHENEGLVREVGALRDQVAQLREVLDRHRAECGLDGGYVGIPAPPPPGSHPSAPGPPPPPGV